MEQKKQSFDVVFILLLIALFTIFALTTATIGANIYSGITAKADENFSSRTSLMYISEKLRQNGEESMISTGTVGDSDALVLSRMVGGQLCHTYIFVYKGMLCEIFAIDGLKVSPEFGQPLIEIQALSVSLAGDSLIKVETQDQSGGINDLWFSLRGK